MDWTSFTHAAGGRWAAAAIGCSLAMLTIATGGAYGQPAASSPPSPSGGGAPVDSATLLQCVSTGAPAERSATFAGEMTMIPGGTRMAMRIELLERTPGETGYHPVLAPGVGAWRTADPGVKSYKHLEQVTNLSAPAGYRALISFRWEGPHGRILRREERRTPRCVQPAPATTTPAAPASPLE